MKKWTETEAGWEQAEMTSEEIAHAMASQMRAYEAQAKSVVQDWLDTKALSHGYDGIVSACSYAAYTNPFQKEGQQFLAWRGEVWQKCYADMAAVQAGTLVLNTTDELIATLPTYESVVVP